MDFEKIHKMVKAAAAEEAAAAGQITLGALIDGLSQCKPDAYIQFRFASLNPGRLRSYRGYYDHLAIEPDGSFTRVADFLQHARHVLGKSFEGYKGGDYVMDDDTPIWVANWGDTSSTRVTGITDDDWRVIIETIETEG